jgi:hypothetical protein
MATYSLLPGSLTLRCFSGDEFAVTLDFDLDLSGYTFTTDIYQLGASTIVDGQLVTPVTSYEQFTVTVLSYTTGTLRLSLTEAQTADLAGQYRFYLRWVAPGDVTRTVLNGVFEIVDDLTLASGTGSDGNVITVAVADTVPSGGLPTGVGAASLLGELIWG